MGEGVFVNVILFIGIVFMAMSGYGTYLNSFVGFVPGSTFENASLLMHCLQEVLFGYPFTSCKCVIDPPLICKNTTHFIGAEVVLDCILRK